jgi:hypothetical protein
MSKTVPTHPLTEQSPSKGQRRRVTAALMRAGADRGASDKAEFPALLHVGTWVSADTRPDAHLRAFLAAALGEHGRQHSIAALALQRESLCEVAERFNALMNDERSSIPASTGESGDLVSASWVLKIIDVPESDAGLHCLQASLAHEDEDDSDEDDASEASSSTCESDDGSAAASDGPADDGSSAGDSDASDSGYDSLEADQDELARNWDEPSSDDDDDVGSESISEGEEDTDAEGVPTDEAAVVSPERAFAGARLGAAKRPSPARASAPGTPAKRAKPEPAEQGSGRSANDPRFVTPVRAQNARQAPGAPRRRRGRWARL